MRPLRYARLLRLPVERRILVEREICALPCSNRSSNWPTDCERTRPQDRNAVAALASKIDPMLAQSRSFVTVQDNDLGLSSGSGSRASSVEARGTPLPFPGARPKALWGLKSAPGGGGRGPKPLRGRRPPFPMEAVRQLPACSDHQHLSEGSPLRIGIGGQRPDQQRPNPVGAGRPKSSRSGARNAMQPSGKTEAPSLARIAEILAKSIAY